MDLYSRLLNEYRHQYEFPDINANRMAMRLSRLSAIGLTEQGGSKRIAFSQEDRAAKEWLKEEMRKAGLTVREDAIGNVFGRLDGREPHLPVVLAGSHIDTVPNGGHFDGTLGVITALEVVQSWREEGYVPRRGVEVVAFSDEEGARFHGGFTGSQVMVGDLSVEDLQSLRDDEGMSFAEVMASHGLDVNQLPEAVRPVEQIHAFVELHIEQGKVLERKNLPVGVVSGIAGPYWLEIVWRGEAGHAGNTPMGHRRDALVGAGEFTALLERLPARFSDTAVATVGKLDVYPGGINVIPGEVKLVVDVRDIHKESRDRLVEAIKKEAETIAERRGLEVFFQEKLNIDPVPLPSGMTAVVSRAIETLGLPVAHLPSGAAHDAMILGRHVPTAMIFVRCKDGISHNPKEWTSLDDIVIGCKVLKETLAQLVE